MKSKILKALRFVYESSPIYAFVSMINHMNSDMYTGVISDRALVILSDPEKAKRLDQEIEKYHKTGKWDYETLTEITHG